ncbi:MAG: DUF2062 domain-containing protein [Desulfobacterium sp.]|nr:DUF2062 domain-containing protein [Desulfobacterium sp.]
MNHLDPLNQLIQLNQSLRIIIVIPVFNHGRTVERVIRDCLNLHGDILVVDDGSTDLPDNFFEDMGVPFLAHGVNRGKGAALMTGARYALEEGYTHMVTIDADGQHLAEDFLRFKSEILKTPGDLIVGRRDFSNTHVPGTSRFGRQFSNFWFRVQTGLSAGDAQSGFRAYPLIVFKKLNLVRTRYDFEIEVLVKAAWAGVTVRSIDIQVYYPEPGKRISHFKMFKDNLRLTLLNTRLTLRSFLPWPHRRIIEGNHGDKFSIIHPVKSIRYFLLNDISPYEIALSGAVGVFLGTLPLVAMHTLAILLVTGFFRLNKIVALGTSQFCMPPIVPAICIEVGYFLTHGGRFLTEISFETLGYQFLDRFYEWCLGALLVAPVLGAFVFVAIYLLAIAIVPIPERDCDDR